MKTYLLHRAILAYLRGKRPNILARWWPGVNAEARRRVYVARGRYA